MLRSNNSIVSYIGRLAITNANSPIGRNVAYLRYKYSVDFMNAGVTDNIARVMDAQVFYMEKQGLINNLRNLLNVKNGIMYIDDIDDEMVNTLIASVACD